MKRQSVRWEQSLRGNIPASDDDFTPLQRLSLNVNSIGDEGVDILTDLLAEEIGLIALDLQDNKISELGASMVERMLHLNKEIRIVDITNNLFGKL